MRQLITIDIILLGDGRFLCCSCYSILLGIKKNTVRKNLFLCVCHCLDPKISLREMNDLYPHGRLIVYGDSYLDSVLRCSKGFRQHAILHDAAGAVYTDKRKGPCCCYIIGRGPNSCLFGLITGLLFCLYLKFFVLSIFNRFNCDQSTVTQDSDNVCQKTILTTYFDKLWFCKFVFIDVSNFLYVYEIELEFFHCVSFLFHRNIT